jgi:hypothetical protein
MPLRCGKSADLPAGRGNPGCDLLREIHSRESFTGLATNLSWNADLAANGGNSASIGFVGNNTGAYPSPAAISLNGTVCTTTYTS